MVGKKEEREDGGQRENEREKRTEVQLGFSGAI